MWPAGTARSPFRGDVGLEVMYTGYRAGDQQCTSPRARTLTALWRATCRSW